MTAARVKGVSECRVVWRHALGNAMLPLVTVIALSYASLLEGAVLTETVFAWPGLGLYITDSLFNADMNAVLGGTFVVGTAFIVLNLLSDFALPRARPEVAMSVSAAPEQGLRAWLLAQHPDPAGRRAAATPISPGSSCGRNPLAMVGLAIIVALLLVAILSPLLAPGTPYGQDLVNRLLPPSGDHWFGTDQLGRDIYTRVIYGSRISR